MTEITNVQPEIVQAGIEDYDELVKLMDRANAYAEERSGTRLWHMLDFVRPLMRGNLENGQLYVIRNEGGEITSSIALLEEDERIWGEVGLDGRALYFEKFMKHPEKARPNEAYTMLRFAADEAEKRDRTLLRCDTTIKLTRLVNYYIELGFTNKGHFIYKPSDKPGILLEAPTAAVREYLAGK